MVLSLLTDFEQQMCVLFKGMLQHLVVVSEHDDPEAEKITVAMGSPTNAFQSGGSRTVPWTTMFDKFSC